MLAPKVLSNTISSSTSYLVPAAFCFDKDVSGKLLPGKDKPFGPEASLHDDMMNYVRLNSLAKNGPDQGRGGSATMPTCGSRSPG